jgi:hypothetical protein
MNAKSKKYHETHKEAIKQRAQERIPCPGCNKCVSRNYMPNHQKTSACMSHVKKEEDEEEEEDNDEDIETLMRILNITRKRAISPINKYQNDL